jgi:signal-transduction protein with cAMP-binding, CBS, and nucleotidyltransferase domain
LKTKIDLYEARQYLLDYMFDKFNVDKELLKDFVNIFDLVSYPKKTLIIKEYENIDKVSFIISGLVRIYYKKEDKEITSWLLSENRFFMPVYHLFTNRDNLNNYEALENTVVLQSTYKRMEEVYKKHPMLERMGRKIVEAYYAQLSTPYIQCSLFIRRRKI